MWLVRCEECGFRMAEVEPNRWESATGIENHCHWWWLCHGRRPQCHAAWRRNGPLSQGVEPKVEQMSCFMFLHIFLGCFYSTMLSIVDWTYSNYSSLESLKFNIFWFLAPLQQHLTAVIILYYISYPVSFNQVQLDVSSSLCSFQNWYHKYIINTAGWFPNFAKRCLNNFVLAQLNITYLLLITYSLYRLPMVTPCSLFMPWCCHGDSQVGIHGFCPGTPSGCLWWRLSTHLRPDVRCQSASLPVCDRCISDWFNGVSTDSTDHHRSS